MASNKYYKALITVENILISLKLHKDQDELYTELQNELDNYYQEINSSLGVSEYSSLLLTCFKYSKEINSNRLVYLINDCNEKLATLKKNHPEYTSKDYYNNVENIVKTMYNPNKITFEDKANVECEKWLTELKFEVENLHLDDANAYGKLVMGIRSFEAYYKKNITDEKDSMRFKEEIAALRHLISKKITQKNGTTRK